MSEVFEKNTRAVLNIDWRQAGLKGRAFNVFLGNNLCVVPNPKWFSFFSGKDSRRVAILYFATDVYRFYERDFSLKRNKFKGDIYPFGFQDTSSHKLDTRFSSVDKSM